MNIFTLAMKQLEREGRLNKQSEEETMALMLDRAIKIRKYMDIQERNKKVALARR